MTEIERLIERVRDAREILRRIPASQGEDALRAAGREYDVDGCFGTRDGLDDDLNDVIAMLQDYGSGT